jgi:hypothetical protein
VYACVTVYARMSEWASEFMRTLGCSTLPSFHLLVRC